MSVVDKMLDAIQVPTQFNADIMHDIHNDGFVNQEGN